MSDLKRPLPNPSPTGYIITSPRLVLRTPRAEDAEPFMRFLSDPENFGYEAGLTIDVFQPRVEKIAARTAAGENAFMIILLRETGDIVGFGGFNSLPRTAILNSSERKSDDVLEGSKVLAGDMGISIDHRYHRKGLAREAICALTDFGFDTLGCEYMHMDTLEDNEGFRALMRDMGLTEKKGDGVEVDDAVFKFAWKSLNYDWDKATWERVKEDLTERALLPKDPDVPSSTLIS
ncbi:hypothetical protein N0V93_006294 [Gnomoniopsis smithogilvyi]|uniref:N-acetyltransferase domain-containing protein n=1 Tax=Gnomoniopsis smithogilvyi TaxID=1191159 RepID=A0A9W9CUC9_9PEZI|nr:hypothetical protein N0V93_006294 [Gnomoniopsis smithogilvyi]